MGEDLCLKGGSDIFLAVRFVLRKRLVLLADEDILILYNGNLTAEKFTITFSDVGASLRKHKLAAWYYASEFGPNKQYIQ